MFFKGIGKIVTISSLLLIYDAAWSLPDILIQSFPLTSKISKQIDITASLLQPYDSLLECSLRSSNSPKGESADLHPIELFPNDININNQTIGFNFNPNITTENLSNQLNPGIHYFILTCREKTKVQSYNSPEFAIQIESETPPSIQTPKGEVSNNYPNFSWTGAPNVPGFHVLLSDQAIQFKENNNDPTDWSIVWQAITSKENILYGIEDPSGFFANIPAPPLVPGKTYTLAIFNNYNGQSPVYTDYNVLDFSLFSIKDPETGLIPPKNLEPASKDTLQNQNNISFKWTSAGSKANFYQLYIYKFESDPNFESEILTPVWNSLTSDTILGLNPTSTFSNGRYLFKVFASDLNQNSVVSDTTSFFYQSNSYATTIHTKSIIKYSTYNDTANLADVDISILSVSGSQDPIPAKTNINGFYSRYMPLGSYSFTFSKSGYIPITISKNVSADSAENEITVYLQPYPETIFGKVLNKDGEGIENCEIKLTREDGLVFYGYSNPLGEYKIGIRSGNYNLSIYHPEYSPKNDSSIQVSGNKKHILSDIQLTKSQFSLIGNIQNQNSVPLVQAKITLSKDNQVVTEKYSDKNGGFIFTLQPDVYNVNINKIGYGDYSQNINFNSNNNLEITLSSNPILVSGTLQALTRPTNQIIYSPCPGARITLTHKNSGTQLQQTSGTAGDFQFSPGSSGTYMVSISKEGFETLMDSLTIEAGVKKISQNFAIKKLASINGQLQFSDTLPSDLNNFELSVINLNNLETNNSPSLILNQGQWTYSFDGLENGPYLIRGSGKGFSLKDSVFINVSDYVWVNDVNLEIAWSNKSLVFQMQSNGKITAGQIYIKSPYSEVVSTPDTLFNAPLGSYLIDLFPANSSILPIKNTQILLDSSNQNLSVYNYNFPFYTDSNYISESIDSVFIKLNSYAQPLPIDSAFVNYKSSNSNYIRVNPKSVDSLIYFGFQKPAGGGKLSFYFDIYSNQNLYSNNFPGKNFSHDLPIQFYVAAVNVYPGKNLSIPRQGSIEIQLSAYNQFSQNINENLLSSGTTNLQSSNPRLSITNLGNLKYRLQFNENANDSSYIYINTTINNISSFDTLKVTQSSLRIHKVSLKSSLAPGQKVFGGDSLYVFASGYDTTNVPSKLVSANFTYSISPVSAGVFEENQLIINPNFIGKLRIYAHYDNQNQSLISELGASLDSIQRGIQVYQSIKPFSTGREFFNGKGILFSIPDSSHNNPNNIQITLKNQNISPSFTSSKNYELISDLYEFINLQGNPFSIQPSLQFILPNSNREPGSIASFSPKTFSWEFLSDTNTHFMELATDSISYRTRANLKTGLYYGVLSPSIPLSISEISLTPNPFSPLVKAELDGNTEYGTRIDFIPHSNTGNQVIIDLFIYNMSGELVKTIIKNQSLAKEMQSFYWNGKTDSNLWARNGRYLAVIIAKEIIGSGVKKYIKPVVLFK